MNSRPDRRRVIRTFAFLTEIESDFLAWEIAIQSYVLQLSKIEDVYDIIDKLGKGSFGFVVLA